MYGGTHLRRPHAPHNPGLSPRVRGNPHSSCPSIYRQRSIPACTGEPSNRSGYRGIATVYPRVYGGTNIYETITRFVRGLSPRVRGNPRQALNGLVRERSIPACTGEPEGQAIPHSRVEVYPRVYGGTGWRRCCVRCLAGLSPRVRGNPLYSTADRAGCRSIPACTGEPLLDCFEAGAVTVYPRVYGGTAR